MFVDLDVLTSKRVAQVCRHQLWASCWVSFRVITTVFRIDCHITIESHIT